MARNDKFDERFWLQYVPQDRAVLCFLRDADQLLLIRKKRGLGAGKINGPGGKTESGESPLEAAVRETIEEVGLEPLDPIHYGTVRFAFTDGYDLEVHIYVASQWRGTLTETDEAEPFWVSEADIPYDRMWEDDKWWLPAVLAGDHVEAEMAFDGDRMIMWNLRFGSGVTLVGKA